MSALKGPRYAFCPRARSREAPIIRRKDWFFCGSTKEEGLEYPGRSDTS